MPNNPHGNGPPDWAPPGMPTQGAQDQHGALTPLGDVQSQAPEAGQYDANLLRPDDPNAYVQPNAYVDPAAAQGMGQRPTSLSAVDPAVRKEIEQAVTHALTRKGVAGTVVLRGHQVELHGVASSPLSVDIGDWVDQWNLLPPDMRDRRADTTAVRMSALLGNRRGSVGSVGNIGALAAKIAGFVALMAVFGGVVWWLDSSGFFGDGVETDVFDGDTSAPVPGGNETPDQSKARHERACEAARSRMYSGASIGVDLDGWVVELWLARKASGKLSEEAALGAIANKGGDLGAKGEAKSEVIADAAVGDVDTVRVRMTEAFVPLFFNTTGRKKMNGLAKSTAIAVKADYAALFARCAHLTSRDVGGWYYGTNRAAAVASLLYAAGAFAEPAAYDAPKHGNAILTKLVDASSLMKPAVLDRMLRAEGGRWIPDDPEAEDGPTAIRFPLGGPTRAVKVTRALAKKLGL
jgi:hypothetical protein